MNKQETGNRTSCDSTFAYAHTHPHMNSLPVTIKWRGLTLFSFFCDPAGGSQFIYKRPNASCQLPVKYKAHAIEAH